VSSANWVDASSFRASMAPVVEAMLQFASSVRAVGPRHGNIADAGSPAMKELSSEAAWARRSGWNEPFRDTHSIGGLTLGAACDYVTVFAQVFNGEHAPVYGHLVLARAALEASVVCWWLSEPGISRNSRAQRGLSEILYSAWEERRLDLAPDARQHLIDVRQFADRLGWALVNRQRKPWSSRSRGKPFVEGEGRPSIPDGIASLLTDDVTSSIGRVQWSRLSAVTHTTFWGLRTAFQSQDVVDSPIMGRKTVPVGTHAGSVFLQVICLLKALRRSADARFCLMGWDDDDWRSAAAKVEKHERHLLEAVRPHLSTLQP
jgi:hypothetical protein